MTERETAVWLADLYDKEFAGKDRGRYRISMKHMRVLTNRRRVPPAMIRNIGEELFELGYVLVDMETFFVVLAHRTFSSCRRINDEIVVKAMQTKA